MGSRPQRPSPVALRTKQPTNGACNIAAVVVVVVWGREGVATGEQGRKEGGMRAASLYLSFRVDCRERKRESIRGRHTHLVVPLG